MAWLMNRLVDRFLHRRSLHRWELAAAQAEVADLSTLRGWRSRARALRRSLDRVIHPADHRLALPVIGSNSIRKPLGTDWAWRPDLWHGPMPVPGRRRCGQADVFCEGATVFHDCRVRELTVRQIRNSAKATSRPLAFAWMCSGSTARSCRWSSTCRRRRRGG